MYKLILLQLRYVGSAMPDITIATERSTCDTSGSFSGIEKARIASILPILSLKTKLATTDFDH